MFPSPPQLQALKGALCGPAFNRSHILVNRLNYNFQPDLAREMSYSFCLATPSVFGFALTVADLRMRENSTKICP